MPIDWDPEARPARGGVDWDPAARLLLGSEGHAASSGGDFWARLFVLEAV